MLLHTKKKKKKKKVSKNFKKIDSLHESETNLRVSGNSVEKKKKKNSEMAPDYKSLLSEFDDYVASSGISRSFEMGDLVWGKVKSHPWWPGCIYNEAFVSPSVRNLKTNGYVLVAFFGDNSYNWFDPAYLLPFELHVSEKSQQTNCTTFVKAVEEALDEISKRSALGLTCKCLNPNNFRCSNVQGGYFLVHVVGYEVEAVYSSKQIKKARESFLCSETLAFVKRCALGLQECDSVEFLKKKAAVLGFRKAVFEEFDETYAEAFKAKSAYSLVKMQEPFSKTPSPRALLSGSLVTAETLRDLESYITAMKVKDSTKQDKHLPKRREEAGDMTVQFSQVQASSSQILDINGSSADGDNVLPRRTRYLQTPSGDIPGKESTVSKLSRFDDDMGLAQESKVRMGEKGVLFPEHLKQDETDTHLRSTKGNSAAGVGIKKVNVLKRSSSGQMNYANGPKKKLKMKKEPKSELNRVNPDKRKPLTFVEAWDKKSSQLDAAERHSTMGNSKHGVVQLLSSLQSLSLDPFFGSSDRSSIKAVRQFFLRFRSFANQETSLAKSPSTTNPSKTLISTNKPSKPERKRLSSDHQQDIPSTKKLKKTIQLIEPITSDKKTNQEVKKSPNLAPLNHPVRDQAGPGPRSCPGPVPINAKPQQGKRIAPSAKVMKPTMLVMKFPFGTSLPSTALLKAKFGRFGPLDQSAIRVFWKSSICRVVFVYNLDAQTALRYASRRNSLFGNVNVTYFLRVVKAYSAPTDHEPKKAKTDKPMVEPLSQRLEQRHQPTIQLKSCLKKPGDNGNGNRGKARVRFMLGGKETETRFRVSGKNNASSSSSSSSSSSCVAMEFVSNNTQNIIVPSTLPLILPLSSQKSKNQVDQVEPSVDQSQSTVDISEEMMKLLLRCNDVMANFTGLVGDVPYHLL